MESGAQAVLATLAYRLVSYWLPFIAGAVAYVSFAAGAASPTDARKGARRARDSLLGFR